MMEGESEAHSSLEVEKKMSSLLKRKVLPSKGKGMNKKCSGGPGGTVERRDFFMSVFFGLFMK